MECSRCEIPARLVLRLCDKVPQKTAGTLLHVSHQIFLLIATVSAAFPITLKHCLWQGFMSHSMTRSVSVTMVASSLLKPHQGATDKVVCLLLSVGESWGFSWTISFQTFWSFALILWAWCMSCNHTSWLAQQQTCKAWIWCKSWCFCCFKFCSDWLTPLWSCDVHLLHSQHTWKWLCPAFWSTAPHPAVPCSSKYLPC